MGANPRLRKPTYAISSVDNAIQLIHMLRDLGEVRGMDAAEELGISRSSVHRLMSMLVFRGFAVKDESRVYHPGPSIGVQPVAVAGAKDLLSIVKPHLNDLRDGLGESAYCMMLTGRSIRFLWTAESAYPTHAEDRRGFVLPAEGSAGGRAILATKSPASVRLLYREPCENGELNEDDMARLQFELRQVTVRGYSFSIEEAERGIVSVAVPIRYEAVRPPSAISIAGPVSHLKRVTDPAAIARLTNVRDEIEHEISEKRSRL
jgi:IclR family acetate operon transcriptional repressor